MTTTSKPPLGRKDSHTTIEAAGTPVNGSSNTTAQHSGGTSGSPSIVSGSAAFEALKSRFGEATDLEILVHCMGGPRVSNIPDIAKELSEHIIVICLDCEHWSDNTDEQTEIGIATFSRKDLSPFVARGEFGDHGEDLLQRVKFYLLRLIESAHLPCMNQASRGVNGNRFGEGRFVTNIQAHKIMEDLFVQPIKGVPSVQENHPIIVLGHDVRHDKENLKEKSTSFDIESCGTVVRTIDTQVIVRERGYWMAPHNEQIGLTNLVKELWFQHSDPHTASNDAARTLICAFQMALGGHACKDEAEKTMLEVASGIEKYSVENFTSIGGVKEYCWRCGNSGHMNAACTATGLVCNETELGEPGAELGGPRTEPGELHLQLRVAIFNRPGRPGVSPQWLPIGANLAVENTLPLETMEDTLSLEAVEDTLPMQAMEAAPIYLP
ncbi:hypothetical protein Alg215_10342 [Pyrenophora tritici-repentis]|nr:hypothetical protein Alg215_10342 [Pyrenophora tritici-repentis]